MGWVVRKLFARVGIVCGLAVIFFVCTALLVGGGKVLQQIVPWAIAGAVWCLASAAAVQMARRKRRNPFKWGVLTFLVWPALFVLLFLKPAAGAATCEACGSPVGDRAADCAHCRHPLTAKAARPWWSPVVEVIGVIAVTGLLLDLVYEVAVIVRSMPDGG